MPRRKLSPTVGATVLRYKSAVVKDSTNLAVGYAARQRSSYEQINRNERLYINIAEYIIDNSAKWEMDRFYTE